MSIGEWASSPVHENENRSTASHFSRPCGQRNSSRRLTRRETCSGPANIRNIALQQGDILVVKHKIVSKAEGQLLHLENIKPSASSRAWARRYKLDARVTELALAESKRIVRRKRGVLITETRHGLDLRQQRSGCLQRQRRRPRAAASRKIPTAPRAQLHRELKKRLKLSIPVIITDSFRAPLARRPDRSCHRCRGHASRCTIIADVAILTAIRLRVSIEAVADELACAAGLVCGKLARTPACIIRGFPYRPGRGELAI